MKKIFAIIVFLLFIGTVFGVASVLGCCSTPTASSTTVTVGDTFTIYGSYDYICPDSTYIQLIETGCGYEIYRAIKPGTITFSCSENCTTNYVAINILPKEYPMFSFMKILGLGKSD